MVNVIFTFICQKLQCFHGKKLFTFRGKICLNVRIKSKLKAYTIVNKFLVLYNMISFFIFQQKLLIFFNLKESKYGFLNMILSVIFN